MDTSAEYIRRNDFQSFIDKISQGNDKAFGVVRKSLEDEIGRAHV